MIPAHSRVHVDALSIFLCFICLACPPDGGGTDSAGPSSSTTSTSSTSGTTTSSTGTTSDGETATGGPSIECPADALPPPSPPAVSVINNFTMDPAPNCGDLAALMPGDTWSLQLTYPSVDSETGVWAIGRFPLVVF